MATTDRDGWLLFLTGGGGQETPVAPGTFFVSESSNKK